MQLLVQNARLQPRNFLVVVALSYFPLSATAQEATELPALEITGESNQVLFDVDPAATSMAGPTTGDLLKRIPGGNINFNGNLTGIVQYRGMFGSRINTQVDGVPITSGGPNAMDAPLHYAPMPLLDILKVQRGIASVSAGSEAIGGHVQAELKSSRFSASDAFEFHGDLSLSGQTADEGYGAGLMLAGSNDSHRIHVLGVMEEGDDTEFADGDIHPTEYERSAHGLGYGVRTGPHEWSIDYFRNETDDAGTPALPMDIRYVDTDVVSGSYQYTMERMAVEAKVFYNEVDHEMTNFHLRQPPASPGGFRNTLAASDATGFALNLTTALGSGELTVGADGNFADHDATIFNPNNAAFFVNNFNDVERDDYGVFAEWRASLHGGWSYELGTRYTRVEMDAGDVDGLPAQLMPGGPGVLRDRFNASDRSRSDDNIDLVAKLFYQVRDDLRLDIGLGRKTRSPSYQETYLWLPLEATAGLADRNRYVGDVTLDPEVAYTIDLGLEWRKGATHIAPRVFYQRVDDYIQGVPATDPAVIMVSTANGDPNPLQFANVDAELYGIDTEFGVQLAERWRVHGVLSYVRGKRRDISDDLYRIAPFNGVLALTHEHAKWAVTAETEFAAQQNQVSSTNEEESTPGYMLLNLFGTYRIQEGLIVTAGVNNVFDKDYAEHLNGYNRVANSDVAIGERLPSAGISAFARIHYRW